ncbi:MAG: SBBP repeat-containing protein [Bacteroidota bacterium]
MNKYIQFLFLVWVAVLHTKATSINKPVAAQYGFIENKGQIIDQNNQPNPGVLYLYNGNGLRVQLRKGGFSYEVIHTVKTPKAIINKETTSKFASETDSFNISYEVHRVDINFKDGNKNATVKPYEAASDYINYYTTATPEEGITRVQHFQKVIYENVYPNIDIEFVLNDVTNRGQFKYNFIVKPHANLADIQLDFVGANSTSLNKEGNILIETAYGNIEENIPLSYVINDNNSHSTIKATFKAIANNIFGINAADYNHNQTLVIDPTNWATYYGGSGNDFGIGIATDANENVLITGLTSSTNAIATVGAHQTILGGGDAFIAKFNNNGVRLWATYYGGSGADIGIGIATDTNGNIIIIGYTSSTNAIATVGAHQSIYGGGTNDAFIAKFNTNGIRQWATYYGGDDYEEGRGIATDVRGNIIITGFTRSTNAIATVGAHQSTNGGFRDAFIAKFNSNGVRQWDTYYGGNFEEYGYGIATDANGNIIITGYTESSKAIATVGAHQTVIGGGTYDAFIVKFNTNGVRQWATYYGESGADIGYGITTDTNGNIIITGCTFSGNVATVGAYQTRYGGGTNDAFIAKFNTNGIRQWATYYGGDDHEEGRGIATDVRGNIVITGFTRSTNAIATVGAYQTTMGGGADAFIVKFNSNGIRQWATYYGGSNPEGGSGITTDVSGNIIITGNTSSSNAIATVGAHQTIFGGSYDAFIAKFSPTDKLIEFNNEKLGSKISLYYENNNPIVKVNSLGASNAIIELISLKGIKLSTYEQAIIAGDNTVTINKNVTPGFYLLKVKLEDEVAFFKVWIW